MGIELPKFNKESIEEQRPKEVWEMTYADFLAKYEKVLRAVAEKEKKGRLDPQSEPYEPVSEEEQRLLESDWKEFSRRRGFSEEDIVEYERWLTLSGQRDSIEGAINDPWRRPRGGYEENLYLKHIDKALREGKDLPASVLEEYNKLKESTERRRQTAPEVPIASPLGREDKEDIW